MSNLRPLPTHRLRARGGPLEASCADAPGSELRTQRRQPPKDRARSRAAAWRRAPPASRSLKAADLAESSSSRWRLGPPLRPCR